MPVMYNMSLASFFICPLQYFVASCLRQWFKGDTQAVYTGVSEMLYQHKEILLCPVRFYSPLFFLGIRYTVVRVSLSSVVVFYMNENLAEIHIRVK